MKKTLLRIGLIVIALLAGAALFFTARQALAAGQVERAWRNAQVEPLTDLGSTSRLEALPLYEEAGDQDRYQVGHGVSYLIKTDAATLLLDVGHNPVEADEAPLTANLRALSVAWDEIDAVIFSHIHPDHVGGVNAWRAGEVSLGKSAVELGGTPVYVPAPFDFPGAAPVLLSDPAVIGPGVATTGVIAYREVFPISLFNPQGAEQALAVHVAGKGMVLFMGCGHPSVERIVSRAEEVFDQPVVGVVGGFHYEGLNAADVQTHLDFLAARNLELVAPSPHDSSPAALEAFQSTFPEAYRSIQVGEPIILTQN